MTDSLLEWNLDGCQILQFKRGLHDVTPCGGRVSKTCGFGDGMLPGFETEVPDDIREDITPDGKENGRLVEMLGWVKPFFNVQVLYLPELFLVKSDLEHCSAEEVSEWRVYDGCKTVEDFVRRLESEGFQLCLRENLDDCTDFEGVGSIYDFSLAWALVSKRLSGAGRPMSELSSDNALRNRVRDEIAHFWECLFRRFGISRSHAWNSPMIRNREGFTWEQLWLTEAECGINGILRIDRRGIGKTASSRDVDNEKAVGRRRRLVKYDFTEDVVRPRFDTIRLGIKLEIAEDGSEHWRQYAEPPERAAQIFKKRTLDCDKIGKYAMQGRPDSVLLKEQFPNSIHVHFPPMMFRDRYSFWIAYGIKEVVVYGTSRVEAVYGNPRVLRNESESDATSANFPGFLDHGHYHRVDSSKFSQKYLAKQERKPNPLWLSVSFY